MFFLYAAVPYSIKSVRMEDAAHCRHKPSSLPSPRTLVMKKHLFGFFVPSFFL